MRIPLTICGFYLQLRISQQLNITIQMFYHLFVDSTNCSGIRKYSCGFRNFAYFSSDLRIPLTICGFYLQLRIPQQLKLTIQMFYHLFVDFTNCSGIRKYSCGFRNFAYFSSDFERYNDLGICMWNPKQLRRSKKSSNVADSATKLILTCCGLSLQCRECTVWPRKDTLILNFKTASCYSVTFKTFFWKVKETFFVAVCKELKTQTQNFQIRSI